MSDKLDELMSKWDEAWSEGQVLPAEALTNDEQLLPRLEEEIASVLATYRSLGEDVVRESLGQALTEVAVEKPNDTPNPQLAFPDLPPFEERKQGTWPSDQPLETTCSYQRHSTEEAKIGGKGVVYKALDEMERTVAIKFLKDLNLDSEEAKKMCKRFDLEAQVTSELDHPGIAPIFGIGSARDGQRFYVMRYVDGETLQEKIDGYHKGSQADEGKSRREQFHDLLRHLVSMCYTLNYAHKNGYLNLDVKPKNVVIGDKQGEVIVLDWGEAVRFNHTASPIEWTLDEKQIEQFQQRETELGHSSARPGGTLGYMGSERMPGSTGEEIGPATDVYSLGVCLYQILTGTLPFRGNSWSQVISNIQIGSPESPSRRKPEANVPKDLEAVCLKAMAKRPSDRYSRAIDLARDIERWLDDEPVEARKERLTERLARWTRRHRNLALGLVASGFLVLVASLIFGWWQSDLRQQAEEARQQNLAVSARFAARAFEYDIEKKWFILEQHASDPQLHQLLKDLQGVKMAADLRGELTDTQSQLQKWLDEAESQHSGSAHLGWHVFNAQGTRLAKRPSKDDEKLPNDDLENFITNSSDRDYFHGKGRRSPNKPAPITKPHLSIPYEGKNSGNLLVAFSVPIRSQLGENKERQVLGVLVMNFHLRDLKSPLEVHLPQDQEAVLVSLEPIEDIGKDQKPSPRAGRKGLILYHPYISTFAFNNSGLEPPPGFIPTSVLEKMRTTRSRRQYQETLHTEKKSGRAPQHSSQQVVEDYSDPFSSAEPRYEGEWTIAFEPIFPKARVIQNGTWTDKVQDVGWVIMVQER